MKAFFITGTDTGVGKTAITAGIAGSMRRLGIDVGIMKPIASGNPQKTGSKSADVAILVEAAGTKDPEELINPVFLPIPTSPYDASKLLERAIDMPMIFTNFKKLLSIHDVLLVEGIGGVMTPITKNFFVADMIKAMAIETIIVTRATLGTLNHTVMTCRMCKDYDIKVKGLVINNFDEKGTAAEKNAPTTLYELTGINILGIVPFIKDLNKTGAMIEVVNKRIDIKSLQ
ncbi:MAG: dethiobiotin synthase [Nitrosopumilaceae archaeon]